MGRPSTVGGRRLLLLSARYAAVEASACAFLEVIGFSPRRWLALVVAVMIRRCQASSCSGFGLRASCVIVEASGDEPGRNADDRQ